MNDASPLTPAQLEAYAFVDRMVPKASATDGSMAPLWHGWALREAFEAGAAWERERCAKLCDDFPAKDPDGPWFNDDMSAGAYACAAAIRAGSSHE